MNTLRLLTFLLLCLRGCCCAVVAGDLPANDAGKNQLIVVGLPDAMPATWFDSNSELKQVKNAVAFTLFAPESKLFKERYQSVLGNDFPIVAYLKPNGAVVYFADRNTLPSNGTTLLSEMKAAALAARNAKPSTALPQEFEINQFQDCVDGNCYPEEKPIQRDPMFPRLRKNPLDTDSEVNWLFGGGGAVVNSVTSGVWMLFAVIACGFVFLFVVLIAGAMFLVSKMWG